MNAYYHLHNYNCCYWLSVYYTPDFLQEFCIHYSKKPHPPCIRSIIIISFKKKEETTNHQRGESSHPRSQKWQAAELRRKGQCIHLAHSKPLVLPAYNTHSPSSAKRSCDRVETVNKAHLPLPSSAQNSSVRTDFLRLESLVPSRNFLSKLKYPGREKLAKVTTLSLT